MASRHRKKAAEEDLSIGPIPLDQENFLGAGLILLISPPLSPLTSAVGWTTSEKRPVCHIRKHGAQGAH